jgi:hypothetical protein
LDDDITTMFGNHWGELGILLCEEQESGGEPEPEAVADCTAAIDITATTGVKASVGSIGVF